MTRTELLRIAKPILFNTEMVRAILDGRKTVTRRIVKKEKADAVLSSPARKENPDIPDKDFIKFLVNSPCNKGKVLYVRETWCNSNKEGVEPDYYYYADTFMCEDYDKTEWKWRPSIHMPKEAARIFLKVTDVRVERLQDMETVDDRNYVSEGAKDKHDFIHIWDATVKDKEKYGWYANPWVWVIEFERIYPDEFNRKIKEMGK